MATKRLRVMSLLALLTLSACTSRCGSSADQSVTNRSRILSSAGSIEADIDRLEQERLRQQRLLEDLRGRIEREKQQAERDAELQRERVTRLKCEAAVEAIRAEASEDAATCGQSMAEYQACLATVSEESAGSTVAGCIIGAFASFFVGPVGLAGCAVGAAAAPDESRCGEVPACDASSEEVLAVALAELGLPEMPTCEPDATSAPTLSPSDGELIRGPQP